MSGDGNFRKLRDFTPDEVAALAMHFDETDPESQIGSMLRQVGGWALYLDHGNYAAVDDPDDDSNWLGLDAALVCLVGAGGLARPMTVERLREICAREFGSSPDYPFFRHDYLPGEDADTALMRLYQAERLHCDSDEQTVLVLCHG